MGLVDTTIEAPPSILPQKRYCDITGLEVCPLFFLLRSALDQSLPVFKPKGPYTDPSSSLRYHDKSIYEAIKGLVGSPRSINHLCFIDSPLSPY
jgi:INO80 complex subunit C